MNLIAVPALQQFRKSPKQTSYAGIEVRVS
jgi:hypothetical protein